MSTYVAHVADRTRGSDEPPARPRTLLSTRISRHVDRHRDSDARGTRTDLPFDPDALREKYRQERDKRLRADGNEQYVEVVGEFAHYLDDPYVEPIRRASR